MKLPLLETFCRGGCKRISHIVMKDRNERQLRAMNDSWGLERSVPVLHTDVQNEAWKDEQRWSKAKRHFFQESTCCLRYWTRGGQCEQMWLRAKQFFYQKSSWYFEYFERKRTLGAEVVASWKIYLGDFSCISAAFSSPAEKQMIPKRK